MSRRVACTYIPNFPLEIFFREQPSFALRPMVVVGDSAGKAKVVALNGLAQTAGIEPGMTEAQAHSLCFNLRIRTRDTERENEMSMEVLRALQNVSPSVQEESAGVYFVDTSGLNLLYKSEKGLARKIISAVRTKLLPVKVGIAKNKFLARVAAEISQSSDFTIVTAGTEMKFLKDIPIGCLDVSGQVLEKLTELGIETIGEVSNFSRSEMALRFKLEGTKLSRNSRGDDPELFSPESLPDKLSRRIVLTYSICRIDVILSHVGRLLDELLGKIGKSGYTTDSVIVDLRLEDRNRISFRAALDRPSTNAQKFIRQIRHELDKQKPASGVNEIRLTIPKALPQISEQLEFRNKRGGAGILTLGNLINLPDFRKLCLPESRDSFLPEMNFRLAPVSSSLKKKGGINRGNEWNHPYAMGLISGLRLLQKPKETEVISEGGVPRAIVIESISREIRRSLGPWQISGGWWDKGFDRFYYEIETSDRKLYLLFYDNVSSRWFIHGIFD